MGGESYSIADLEAFASRFYQGRPLLITPYAYSLTFSGLAAGATASQVINIAANADFIGMQFAHRSYVTSASNVNVSTKDAPFIRILVTDSGSNEQFTNQAIDIENYSTNGNTIRVLPYPRIISGRSSLTVQLTNYSASATYGIDVSFEGVLVRAYKN
jgi:hypothetical protein